MENKMAINDEELTAASGGTFSDFVSLRRQIERYCAKLLTKTQANPEDQACVAEIQRNLQSAMDNEPQCMYFLQKAGEAAKQLHGEALKAELLANLDKWCDVIYQ